MIKKLQQYIFCKYDVVISMIEVPNDIFFEIVLYLDYDDYMNLRNTSKILQERYDILIDTFKISKKEEYKNFYEKTTIYDFMNKFDVYDFYDVQLRKYKYLLGNVPTIEEWLKEYYEDTKHEFEGILEELYYSSYDCWIEANIGQKISLPELADFLIQDRNKTGTYVVIRDNIEYLGKISIKDVINRHNNVSFEYTEDISLPDLGFGNKNYDEALIYYLCGLNYDLETLAYSLQDKNAKIWRILENLKKNKHLDAYQHFYAGIRESISTPYYTMRLRFNRKCV